MGLLQRIGQSIGFSGSAKQSAAASGVPAVMGIGLDEVLHDDPKSFQAGLFRQSTPPERGTDELLELYSASPWLRAVSHKVAGAVGGVQWQLYAKPSTGVDGERSFALDKKLRRATGMERRRVIREMREAGELVEIDNHPLLDLLENPNPIHSGADLFHCGQVHYDVVGETFLIIEPGPAAPRRLWVAPPTWLDELPIVGREEYVFSTPDGARHAFPAPAVIHHKDSNPADPYSHGTGLGRAAADELDVDEFASKHVASWFHNKGMPDMLVSMKGARREALERAKRQWDNAVRGFRKSYRTHWTGAELDVQRLDTAFKDMALVEIRAFARDLVISLWGVPPEKLGIITNSNRATIDAADFLFAKDVVDPRLEKWRQTLQNNLVPFYDDRLVLDYVSPVEEDREFQRATMQAFPAAFKIDEVRELAGMGPLDDGKGEGFLVAQGTQYVDDLTKLAASSVFAYHLASGALTYNELRASMGLEPSTDFGDERTVGFYQGEGFGGFAAGAAANGGALPGDTASPSAAFALPPVPPEQQRAAVRRSLSAADIRAIVSAVLAEDLGAFAEPVVEQLVADFGEETAQAISSSLTFDPDAPDAAEHVKSFVDERVDKLVNETTRLELLHALTATVDEGGTDEDVVAAARSVFDKARTSRSEAIAETEVRRSSQFASTEAMKQSGVPLVREWVTALDGRARPDHVDLDGQQRDLDAPFVVPRGQHAGAQTMFPGAFGIAALDARCRCVVVPVLLDEGEEFDALPLETRENITAARESGLVTCASMTEKERGTVWRALDEQLLGFDDKMRQAFVKGFDKQLERVLSELRGRL